MPSPHHPTCPVCGRSIPGDSPGGCCPWCLLGWAAAPAFAASAAPEGSPPEARRFGDYELIERIAEGASGIVYRARHLPLNRPVALKLIRSGQFATAEERRRFRLEAEAAANLDHPHIVPVFEVGEHEGWPFLAMKLVEGKSLAEWLRGGAGRPASEARRPLTSHESAALLATITRAVQHAHRHGILHRDLKPGNVLLDHANRPHLTDFGLAKWLKRDLDHTLSQALLGTPQYMSPEQASGHTREVTVASDVFSLGAMLYELVCGQPPFRGSTQAETLQRVLEANPRAPRTVNPRVDRDLETICLKCLERDPARRYPSADALAEDMERWQRHEPIRARRAGLFEKARKWVRRNPALAGLWTLVFVLLFGGSSATARQFLLTQRARAEVQGATAIAKVQLARESLARGKPHDALALLARVVRNSPDHRIARDTLLAELCFRHFPLPLAAPPKHAAEVTWIEFSRDGRYLATASADGTAAVWDTQTNGPALSPLRHSNEVNSVVFSPDGERLATASLDGTARIWAFPSGRLLATLQHQGPVRKARFSPDGRRVATASDDHTARLADARTGVTLLECRDDSGAVRDACFSADGAWLLTVGHHARLWDASTGQAHGTLFATNAPVHQACFNPRGDRVLTAGTDGCLRLWNTAEAALIRTWSARTTNDISIEFSPDGTRVVTAAADNTARLWDPNTGQEVGPPMVHARWVDFAHFSPDGSKIITGSRDEIFRLWNATNSALWCAPTRGHGFAMAAAFSPEGQRLATGSATGASALWDIRPGAAHPLLLPHQATVLRAEFDAGGQRVVTASCDGTARVWDAGTGAQLTPPLAHTGFVNVATFSPRGEVILTASDDRTARLWDAQTGQPLSPPLAHTGKVQVACFAPRGERFATACTYGHARVWDVATTRVLHDLPWPGTDRPWDAPIASAQFTPDGKMLVLGCMDNTVRVCDLTSTNESAQVLLRHTGPVAAAAISPDGKRVAGVSWDFTAFLAELTTGQLRAPPLRHEDMVFHVTFRRDGLVFATSGHDGTARLWDGFTGRTLAPPLRHDQLVYWSDFSPDGTRVVTASMDGTAQVWDSHTGLPIGPALQHGGRVGTARFNPAGQRLVTTCGDGNARLWDMPSPVEPPPDWVPALAEALVGQRINDQEIVEEVPVAEFLRLRRQLLATTGTNLWSRWGHWFAADRSTRSGSPFAGPAR